MAMFGIHVASMILPRIALYSGYFIIIVFSGIVGFRRAAINLQR